MLIFLKKEITEEKLKTFLGKIKKFHLQPLVLINQERKIVLVEDDNKVLPRHLLLSNPEVVSVLETTKLYQLASRETRLEDTIVRIGKVKIGGEKIVLIAGPCAVENKNQIVKIAKSVKKAGACILRGGAFKPRTSPYSFQGLGKRGLVLLAKAAKIAGLKIVTEVVDPRDINLVGEFSDIFQIGARNMQNFSLLKEVGKAKKPVLLKRGMWASYKEFLLAAEYILKEGNSQVILCERGIRTFVRELRFTLDLAGVAYLKKETHLPIVVDPSHGTGRADLVLAASRAAIAAGADGLLIETHFAPKESVSDAAQTISLEEFKNLAKEVKKIAQAIGRKL